MKWMIQSIAVALVLGLSSLTWAGPCLYEAPGDMDDDGATEADDIQCSILISLWALGEADDEDVPECAAWGHAGTDVNCDSSHTMLDPAVATAAALGLELPEEIDSNGDGCPDACEAVDEPLLSCIDNCGGVTGGGCWCDASCPSFGDCCEDACLVCGSCPPEPSECGDAVCDFDESCETCAEDCGECPVCGDGECNEFTENCFTCGEDCGECTAEGDCCSPDGTGTGTPGCSDAACVETVCTVNPFCCIAPWDSSCATAAAYLCDACGGTTPVCGDGECSIVESCTTCEEDCGACDTCGDGTCNGSENCFGCEEDCGACPVCGDGTCNGSENCFNCEEDCIECPPAGTCCEPNGGIGCDDETCTAAVCALDSFCCNTAWDGICANSATELCEICGGTAPVCGDGECAPSETCETCSADCGECPFCGDGECNGFESCFSCEEDCDACPTCGDGVCNGSENCVSCEEDCVECAPAGGCCEANGGIGCEDEECTTTVCALDSFCCNSAWDGICANQALGLCEVCGGEAPFCGDGTCDFSTEVCETCPEDCGECPFCGDGTCNASETCVTCSGDCGECPAGGDCCAAGAGTGTPGCADPTCTAVVCGLDPFCCSVQWDAICVNQALEFCDACSEDGPVCGDGFCNEITEVCETCPEDCGACP